MEILGIPAEKFLTFVGMLFFQFVIIGVLVKYILRKEKQHKDELTSFRKEKDEIINRIDHKLVLEQEYNRTITEQYHQQSASTKVVLEYIVKVLDKVAA